MMVASSPPPGTPARFAPAAPWPAFWPAPAGGWPVPAPVLLPFRVAGRGDGAGVVWVPAGGVGEAFSEFFAAPGGVLESTEVAVFFTGFFWGEAGRLVLPAGDDFAWAGPAGLSPPDWASVRGAARAKNPGRIMAIHANLFI